MIIQTNGFIKTKGADKWTAFEHKKSPLDLVRPGGEECQADFFELQKS